MFIGAIDEELAKGDLSHSLFAVKKELGIDLDRAIELETGVRLTSLIIGCDLLILGFQELSPDKRWFFEISSLDKLRGLLFFAGRKLIKSYPFESIEYISLAKALFNYPRSEINVRTKTVDYLKKLETLQGTHDKLQSQLSELQDTLW